MKRLVGRLGQGASQLRDSEARASESRKAGARDGCPARRWDIDSASTSGAEDLARELSCSSLLARLLRLRGITTADEARSFLSPKLSDLHEPDSLPNIELAVTRVHRALELGESIAVFGDYDVDGVSSTALLLAFFRFIDRPVRHRLPNRLSEGYGIKPDAVRALAAEGVQLIITVDNGVSALAAIETANELGVDVVVVDHHEPPAHLPPAVAIVNPCLNSSEYPYRHLAGVGVTFKFVWALCRCYSRQKKLSEEFRNFLIDSLSLVALGTVADVVPLLGENRLLTAYGLRALQNTSRPGLRFLVDSALPRPERESLNAEHIGFRIAPLLNAAGRLGNAEDALSLLVAPNAEEAARLGAALTSYNQRRRQIEKEMQSEAKAMIRDAVDVDRETAIVLGSDGWHVGVVGIVAARISEEYFRPTLLVAFEGERGRGSARSVPGVNIAQALSDCEDCLVAHGGHQQAAGVEILAERLSDLRSRLNGVIRMEGEERIPRVATHGRVRLSELTVDSIDELNRLEPFGEGNPAPLFVIEGLEIVGSPKLLGAEGSHLAFHVREGGEVRRAIAFGQADSWDLVTGAGKLSVLATPKLSTWRQRTEVELHVREIRPFGN
ncbi:MAG: single-stranded-DNA-specific exonuclease RecJ [Planctomycetes bacterium]|nr:single-stranded-DNA-specific exonuclease RecJ [Planctomycetota bacterium]